MLVCPAVFKTVCGRLKTCRMSSILIHPRQKKRESGGSAEPPLSCSFYCGKIRYLVENGRFLPQNVVSDTHGLTNGGE